MRDLLLEIGTEEIPAKFMPGAITQLRELALKELQEARLSHGPVNVYGTPRRLAVYIQDVAEAQEEVVEEVKGPAKKAAFGPDGAPTKAAEGFARGQGVAVADLVTRALDNGEYVFAMRRLNGQPALTILPGVLDRLVRGLNFPKPMRWGNGEFRFARPIRWLVTLFGEEIIEYNLEGLVAGRLSSGHRFLSTRPVAINEPAQYLDTLRESYVIADQDERRQLIREQVAKLAEINKGVIREDEELLEEIIHLVEYPTALCGGFAGEYLELPKAVVITPMREHQRYFPVENQDGQLLPRFIAVRNGTADHLDIVREGNEKVLKARLADARFFYAEDLKEPLAAKVPRLQKIVFQESLGTLYAKVERIIELVGFLGKKIGLGSATVEQARRAAYLAKADLVTNMVYEFPELQGVMGEEYARQSGEPEPVAQAILEHYQPRFAGDALPAGAAGALVAIADKIDTIVGCFAVGIQPTGSQDPYALRRQALGICHIILDRGLSISLVELFTAAYGNYQQTITPKVAGEKVAEDVAEFFRQRLRNIFLDRGFTYDVVDAVLAAGFDRPAQLAARVQAVADFRGEPSFGDLLTAFTRASNLSRKANGPLSINPELLKETVEQDLYQMIDELAAIITAENQAGNFKAALQGLARLATPLAAFFEGVMVMAQDEAIRNNRLGLLQKIANLGGTIADFSKINA